MPSERFTISPARYRLVALFALSMICIIVVTGAAVRLTGSGMGCETWPRCTDADFVQFSSPNQAIEQANRLFTGLVSVSVAAAVLGSMRLRPYRRDLVAWSWSLVAGVVGQIVLGGITVLVHLHPLAVAGHFVLSMVLVVCATVLTWKAFHPPGPVVALVDRAALRLSGLAALAACALMVTGPLVTGSGPHAGDEDARRFGFFIPDVARAHAINMWIYLALIVVVLVHLARTGAPAAVRRRGQRLLVAIVAQGAIGYLQYELGIPAWIVTLHIIGATTVVTLTVWFLVGLWGSAPDAVVPRRRGKREEVTA